MINLDELDPALRAFEKACNFVGFPVLIYSGKRSNEEQAILFRNGRKLALIEATATTLERKWRRPDLAHILLTAPPQIGKRILTFAAPGQSAHNYGLAFDGVPLRAGKPVWELRTAEDRALWTRYGNLIESVGLEWAGRWKRFREMPHAQLRNFDWRELIKT